MGGDSALYVAGLPLDTTDYHLYRLFSPLGAIAPKGVRAMLSEDFTCKGIGFVNYLDRQSAELAISIYNGTVMPDGNRLKVAIKMNRKENAPHVVPAPAREPVPTPQVVAPATTWISAPSTTKSEVVPPILVPPNVVLPALEANTTPTPVDWQSSSAALEEGNMIPSTNSEEEKLRLRLERFGKM